MAKLVKFTEKVRAETRHGGTDHLTIKIKVNSFMGPKETCLLKAPLDVDKVANVAVIEKTNNQKENTESSKTVSADLYKGSTRNPSDVIFAKEWNTHGGKNCLHVQSKCSGRRQESMSARPSRPIK